MQTGHWCIIDCGDETLQIVTGAQNIFEGACVPVGVPGAVLANEMKIKVSKLRGGIVWNAV